MTHPERLWLFGAAVAVALVPAHQAVVENLYHGFHNRHDVYLGAAGFVAFVAILAAVLAVCGRARQLPLKFFLFAFLLNNIHMLLRIHVLDFPVPMAYKLTVAALALVLFGFLFVKVGTEGWQKMAKAAAVASLIFVLSPALLALGGAPAAQGATVDYARTPGIANYLVLVLDETSPEYAAGMRRTLEAAQLQVQWAEVDAAGKDTLNAIPSMFAQRRHDDVAPCTGSALCGGQSFDFAKVQARSKDIDIVGFYHPYCAIGGLRSCVREEHVFAESSSMHFGITLWCLQFSRRGLIPFCGHAPRRADAARTTRENMLRQIDQAPFWRSGGLLYVHFPLPHPSMTADFPSLKSEYEASVASAEQLLASLSGRMRAAFGDDFLIVVTSDHPLRTATWCATADYARPDCATGLPADRGKVPLMRASPGPLAGGLPASTLGLMSVAPARQLAGASK